MKVEEYFDDSNGKVKREVPTIKAPHKPTKEDWEKHQATHTPYEPWCKHCLAGRAIRQQHPSKGRRPIAIPDIEGGDNQPIKVSIDYMYLHERVGKYRNVEPNPPPLVMIDHSTGRGWAYRVPNKGVMDGVVWLPKRIIQDIANCGHDNKSVQLKADQEPSIVALQTALQELRSGVVPINSPVGESESSGRVENAIRRVQEKIRVLRHQVEQGIKQRVPDEDPIMAWLIRWAAEPISKYYPGDDSKTAYARTRKEAVMYLPLKTASGSKAEPIKKLGICLGTTERTEETLVGTARAVTKCRTVSRLSEDDRWNEDLVINMKGVPW